MTDSSRTLRSVHRLRFRAGGRKAPAFPLNALHRRWRALEAFTTFGLVVFCLLTCGPLAAAPGAEPAPPAKPVKEAPSAAQVGQVEAGKETPLYRSHEKLDVTTDGQRGHAKVVVSGTGDAKIEQLIYLSGAKEATEDKVAFSEGGVAHTIAISITPAVATGGFTPGTAAYEAGLKALFLLFVLAVLLESALAGLFNWRPFVEKLNARAVRPLVSFAVALILVFVYDLDIITSLIDAARQTTTKYSLIGSVLTALVLAGGSSAVNNIMVALGYRKERTPETVTPKPPSGKAWIAVKLIRRDAVGPVQVLLGLVPPPPAAGAAPPPPAAGAGQPPPLVGVISGEAPLILPYFQADKSRFPSYGGHAVPKDNIITIQLVGRNRDGVALPPSSWGPYPVAEGAIIDIALAL